MLKLGMLSNLSKEKGVFKTIDTLIKLQKMGVDAQLELAGPVDPNIKIDLQRKTSTVKKVYLIGPKYGTNKWKWFESLDYFLFPTNYHNEAYPLVILESLSRKIPVLSSPKGCIECMLPKEWIFNHQDYEDLVSRFIHENLKNMNMLKDQAFDEFMMLTKKDSKELSFYISTIKNTI